MCRESFTSIHGLSKDELENSLRNTLTESTIDVSSCLLGGWSNLNILITINGQKGVLRLPGLVTEFETNPFENEYALLSTLHTHGISPRPVFIGRLHNNMNTPFIIYEFVKGRVIGSFDEFSNAEKSLLKQSLSVLSQTHAPFVPFFKSASDYIDSLMNKISDVQLEISPHDPLLELIAELEVQLMSIYSYINDIEWRTGFMHGDLQENNIVFCKDRAVFLDFEFSAIGDPLLDIAYLHNQRFHSSVIDESLIPQGDSVERASDLVPLALAFAISWGIEHIAHYSNGLLEPNLMVHKTHENVVLYTKSKLKELKDRLETI